MKPYTVIIGVAVLALIAFRLSGGSREATVLANIHGIPYPQIDQYTVVTERLAHADVYFKEPVVGKELYLEITFTPLQLNQLSVGVRENAFWLSYPKYVIYRSNDLQTTIYKLQTRSVTIPLTDKLRDQDGSIDLMFFADFPGTPGSEDLGLADTTLWHLHHLRIVTSPALPSMREMKDYALSLLTREKPL